MDYILFDVNFDGVGLMDFLRLESLGRELGGLKHPFLDGFFL
jgi:hypothetical protein